MGEHRWVLTGLALAYGTVVLTAPAVPATDCNGNGRRDSDDVRDGTSEDCDQNAVPDECDVRRRIPGYAEPRLVPVAGSPLRIVASDLDGDGDLDLAAAFGGDEGSVGWLEGAGDATFEARPVVPAPGDPVDLEASDLDGEGRAELVVLGGDPGVLAVFAVSGSGELVERARWELDSPARAFTVLDVGGDGDRDIVVASRSTELRRLLVLEQGEAGTFFTPAALGVSEGAIGIAAGDFDGDGLEDIGLLRRLSAYALFQEEDGSFVETLLITPVPGAARDIAAGDLDGDSDVDLVPAYRLGRDGIPAFFENSGDGLFVRRETAIPADRVVLGDADGDGNDDPVFVLGDQGSVWVPGVGWVAAAGDAVDVALGDFDGDGLSDVAVALEMQPSIAVLLNHAPFPQSDCDANGVPDSCDVRAGRASDCNGNGKIDSCDFLSGRSADADKNGIPDECDADCDGDGVYDAEEIARGAPDCNGNAVPDSCDTSLTIDFRRTRSVPPGVNMSGIKPTWVVGDFDGDGDDDLAAADLREPKVVVHRSKGRAGFSDGTGITFDGRRTREKLLYSADFDRDGRADLLVVSKDPFALRLFLSVARGGFADPVLTSDYFGDIQAATAADLDGDDALDLVVATLAEGDPRARRVIPLRNSGAGRFETVSELSLPLRIRALAAADLDNDGTDDVIVASGEEVVILGSERGGALAETRRVAIPRVAARLNDRPDSFITPSPTDLAPADLDRDGNADIVVPLRECHNGDVAVLFGDGELGIRETRLFFTPFSRCNRRVALEDFDGDGDVDIALARTPSSNLAILLNHGRGTFSRPLFVPDVSGVGLASGDMDGDGSPDLVRVSSDGFSVIERSDSLRASDCNFNGVPDECDLEAGRSPDCNSNGVPDECDLRRQRSSDLNGNGVPDECDVDCDGDGIYDRDEIARGAPDCNFNGVPDECDLEAGTAVDCDANGVPDECDLTASDPKPDCDRNGIPDECDLAAGADDCDQNGVPDRCDTSPDVRFEAAFEATAPWRRALDARVVDLDGDGWSDIVWTAGVPVGFAVRWGLGGGALSGARRLSVVSGFVPHDFLALDLDGDGLRDLVLRRERGETFAAYQEDDRRLFSESLELDRDSPHLTLAGADLDGDGRGDVIAGVRGGVTAYRSGPGRSFLPPESIPTPGTPIQLAARDLDRDGAHDVVALLSSDLRFPAPALPSRLLSVLRNDGRGTLATPRNLAVAGRADRLAVGDFDGDGDVDAAAGGPAGFLQVFVNPGSGALEARTPGESPSLAGEIRGLAAADIDGDGADEIVDLRDSRFAVRRADHRAVFGAPWEFPIAGPLGPLAVGDLDGDAFPDVVLPGSLGAGPLLLLNRSEPARSADRDRDHRLDDCDDRVAFRRGDVDADGGPSITDAVALLLHLFRGGTEPACLEAADIDDDGILAITDAVRLLRFLFLAGPPPAPPGFSERCGIDPDPPGGPGELGCARYDGC